MITKTANDSGSSRTAGPYKLAAQQSHKLGQFKGRLHFKNLSTTATAQFRVEDTDTHRVPAQGDLTNYPPTNEIDKPIEGTFVSLVIYNDSKEAAIEITEYPNP